MSKLARRSILPPPVWLVEYMYSMLSTPLICCSMGVATDCSSASAAAPGGVGLRSISGGAMVGYCAMGSCTITTTPAITMRIEITMATMGRLMKNLAIVVYLDLAGGGGAAL